MLSASALSVRLGRPWSEEEHLLGSTSPNKRGMSKQQPLGLKNEANAEVPKTCILSNGQQEATPLAVKRSQIRMTLLHS